MKIGIIQTTCPTSAVARQIGTLLVECKLAACVKILPTVESIYRWEGQVHRDVEAVLQIKTLATAKEDVFAAICENHPYDVPEIFCFGVDAVSAPYGEWLAEQID